MKIEAKKIAKGSVLAILATSLLPTAIMFIALHGYSEGAIVAITVGIVSLIVASVVLLVWGLPIHLFFSRLGKTNPMWYGIAGFVPAPIFVFLFKPFGLDPIEDLTLQTFYVGACGAIGAVIFWFYVVRTSS